jgi:DNA-directed RNA polymerase subunit M/transcription elongation factor TFIIS
LIFSLANRAAKPYLGAMSDNKTPWHVTLPAELVIQTIKRHGLGWTCKCGQKNAYWNEEATRAVGKGGKAEVECSVCKKRFFVERRLIYTARGL